MSYSQLMVKSYRFKLIILAVNIKTGKLDDDSVFS